MACISGIYLLISMGLSFTDIAFRTWASVLGKFFVGIITPIMILVLALAFLCESERVHQAVKVVCITAAVIVCGIYVCFVMFFILLGSQAEQRLTKHLLVTDESFLSEVSPVYYRPTAIFFKRKTKVTKTDQVEYLEKKYDRPFGLSERSGVIYDLAVPDVRVSVWPSGMFLVDDYVEKATLYSLLEAYRALHMERDYHIIRAEADDLPYFCLEAAGYDDIPTLSRDITRLYEYVLGGRTHIDAGEIYQEYSGRIYYSFGETERDYTGSVFFKSMNKEEPIDVEALVRIAYQQNGVGQSESVRNPIENTEEGESSVEETAPEFASEPEPETESETDYREVAARAVYDAALAEEGFSYAVYYNAKGNLYIDLGTKMSEEDGKTYSYSLVYDRASKNNACELLVLYRTAEGSDYEEIVDMYAVENATGKVVASGRKAWSDVGTKEYREMTGE